MTPEQKLLFDVLTELQLLAGVEEGQEGGGMKMLTDAQLKELLEKAYMAGWSASGEGWNDEYPGDAHERESWQKDRDANIAAIMEKV